LIKSRMGLNTREKKYLYFGMNATKDSQDFWGCFNKVGDINKLKRLTSEGRYYGIPNMLSAVNCGMAGEKLHGRITGVGLSARASYMQDGEDRATGNESYYRDLMIKRDKEKNKTSIAGGLGKIC